jgi:hypothetical protein
MPNSNFSILIARDGDTIVIIIIRWSYLLEGEMPMLQLDLQRCRFLLMIIEKKNMNDQIKLDLIERNKLSLTT